MNIKIIRKCPLYLFILVLPLSQSFADLKTDTAQSIEKIRKGNLNITVTDSNAPAAGVKVEINQIKHQFGFGSAINYNISNPQYADYFKKHFEWAVMENESKWYSNEPNKEGNVTYEEADKIAAWCKANEITMRGHCIFWEKEKYAQKWLKDLKYAPLPAQSPLRTAVENRLNSVVPHFKGQFVHWDVDNEILAGSFYKDRLGEEIWYWMFNAAHKIDPNCRLFVNEYDVLWRNHYDTTRYENFIKQLQAQNLPLGGIGIQGHVEPNFSRPDLAKALDNLGKYNLPVWITEFDVAQPDPNLRADALEDFYRICFSRPSVQGIMMWGFWQKSHWRPNCYIVNEDWANNQAGNRFESLMKEWTTNESLSTDSSGKANFKAFYGKYKITLTAAGKEPLIKTIDVLPNEKNDFTFQLADNSNRNIILNPGFEDSKGWSPRGGTFTQSTEQKHSGLSSGKSTDRKAGWHGIKQSLMGKIKIDTTYQVSAWIKLDNAATADVAVSIEQHDDNGVAYTNLVRATANNSDWTNLTGTMKIKPAGTLTMLDLYFEGPPAGVNFYVDDVNVFGPPAEAKKTEIVKPTASAQINSNVKYQKLEGLGVACGWYDITLSAFSDKPEFYPIAFKDLGVDILRIKNTYGYTGSDAGYTERVKKIITNANKVLDHPLKVMISSWSPPPALKSNNNTKGGTLAKDANGVYKYDAYAQWWYDSLNDLHSRGIFPAYLSIQNEPDYITGWDTCRFDPCQANDFAGYNLAFAATMKKLSTLPNLPKMLAPECKNITSTKKFINALSAENKSLVYGYAHHLYGDGNEDEADSYIPVMTRFAKDFGDKPLFQTEFARENNGGDVSAYPEAMTLALLMHNTLAVENASCFMYWNLIWETPCGLISTHQETYKINPIYYAFRHFAAFTDPNWQRIEVVTDNSALRISAFISPAGDKITAIIINPSQTDIKLDLKFSNFNITDSEIYRTTENEKFISAGKFTKDFVVLKDSINTLILSIKKMQ